MCSRLATPPEAASHPNPPAVPSSLFEKALLIREFERRLLDLFGQGKLFGTVHTCIGQEFTGVAVAEALEPGDRIFTNHRGHGHFLARTGDVDGLMAELMGRRSGICGGRGGSQHMCGGGVYSNGIQGGIVPVTAGLALAESLRGTGSIAVVFIGDGTLGEGAIYEAMNLGSLWDLPLLIVLENNAFAQSTPQAENLAGEIEARARAFGIEASRADTWDVPRLVAAANRAVGRVRSASRPHFLRVDTDRLMAHSKGDDDRDPALIRSSWLRDALSLHAEAEPAEAAAMAGRVKATIDAAVARAEASEFERPGVPEGPPGVPARWSAVPGNEADRFVNLIYKALRRALDRDDRVVLLGEDIQGPYGGAFKVTKDLSLLFPGRVRNTSISESAIVGIGNGLALAGMVPVCEIMFGDFLTLAADQWINHASKFAYMYNDQVAPTLIVRTPMGGKRGYGPTHSQSLEKHFIGLPGTRVIALNQAQDPGRVYDTLFETVDRPTLVIENKLLYGARPFESGPAGFAWEQDDAPFPTTRLRPASEPDLTILCYGGMLGEVEAAAVRLFDESEVAAEVVCPMSLYPLDLGPIAASVARSGRLLVVEEGIGFAAFGAEVIARLVEGYPGLVRTVRRVSSPEHPIPSSGPLERQVLPGTEQVVAAAREVVGDV